MRRGLVFGKYMPLHRGHQFVIDRALAECDEVTIVVYDSKPEGDYPAMPLNKRLGWLRELYPHVETIVGVDDPVAHDSDNPDHAAVYADQLSFLGQFDRVFTSEPRYERFAEVLKAKHVLVDVDRVSVPISGTEIRTNLYDYRGWIDPRVYTTLIQKVVFVGTESAGKSTIARRMAEEYDTLWVHEFGRELWESQNLEGTFQQHLGMAQRQYEREQAMARHANRFLFCDTNAWTTLMWSLNTYGYADARLKQLVEDTKREYVWVLCHNDFGWVQDGTRELEGGKADAFQRMQINHLSYGIAVPYYEIEGSLEDRVDQMREILNAKPLVTAI